MRTVAAIAMLSLMGCGRLHTVTDGVYRLSLNDVRRDDCGLASGPGVITTGVLKTTGNLVSFAYGFLEIQLFGTYRSGIEEMTLDGTAVNVTTQVRQQECLLDTVALHLDGAAESPTRFSGAMSIAFDARQPDACACKFWFSYTADREGDAP